jgi:hypothetical protein
MSISSSIRSSRPLAVVEEPTGPKPTPEELEEFKHQVAQWIHLDDQVRKLVVAVKERKTAMNALNPIIQTFMAKYHYDDLSTQSGKIRTSKRTVRAPIKMSEVKNKLLELDSGDELVKKIFEAERPIMEKTSLRRIIPKVSLSLDI